MKRHIVEWLVKQLQDEIDDAHFNMGAWLVPVNASSSDDYIRYNSEDDIPHCKTAGCIAGSLFLKLTPQKRQEYLGKLGPICLVERVAIHELGASEREASAMFEPRWPLDEVTRQDAIAMLQWLLQYNEINWPEAVPHLTDSWSSRASEPITVEWAD